MIIMAPQQEHLLDESLGDVLERLIDAVDLSASKPHEILKGLASQGITTWQSFVFMEEDHLESIQNLSPTSKSLLLHLKNLVMTNIEKETECADLPSTYTKEMYTQYVKKIRLQNWKKWKSSVQENEVPKAISFPTLTTPLTSVATPPNIEKMGSNTTTNNNNNNIEAVGTRTKQKSTRTRSMATRAAKRKQESVPTQLEANTERTERTTRASARPWNDKSLPRQGEESWHWLVPPETTTSEESETDNSEQPSLELERPLRSNKRWGTPLWTEKEVANDNRKKRSKVIENYHSIWEIIEKGGTSSATSSKRASRYNKRTKIQSIETGTGTELANDNNKKHSTETAHKGTSAVATTYKEETSNTTNKRASRYNKRAQATNENDNVQLVKKTKRKIRNNQKLQGKIGKRALRPKKLGELISTETEVSNDNNNIHTAIFGNASTNKPSSEREIFLHGGDGLQKYGKPTDFFWNIVGNALGFVPHETPYTQQQKLLASKGFVLFDEPKIQNGMFESPFLHDLPRFVLEHPNLKRFIFSGKAAAAFQHRKVWGEWIESAEACTTLHDTDGKPYKKTLYTKFWMQGNSLSPQTFPNTTKFFGKKKNVETVDEKSIYDWCKDRTIVVDDTSNSDGPLLRRSIECIVLPSPSSHDNTIRPSEKEKIWHTTCFKLQETPEGYKCPGCELRSEKSTTQQISNSKITSIHHVQNHQRHWFADCPHTSDWETTKRKKWTNLNFDPFYWYS